MLLRGRPVLAALLLISLLLPLSTAAVAARTPASRPAATAPFTPPDAWQTLCATQRPAGRGLRAGVNCRWLKLDGVFRRYVVVVPAAVAAQPTAGWPMVLMYHGYGGIPGASYRVVLLLGVHHGYPAWHDNPAGHSLAATSWPFFRTHPMP